MKFLLPFLFLVSTFEVVEEQIVFDLNECLEQSSIIIKGSVTKSGESIACKKKLKGSMDDRKITLPHFTSINELGHYAPKDMIGWDVVVFLNRDQHQQLIPIDYYGGGLPPEYLVALSIVWIKDDLVYFGTQPTNPGPVIFDQQMTEDELNNYIETSRNQIKP